MGIGNTNDRVSLILGTSRVLYAEEYTVHVSILQQPANFTIKVGNAQQPRLLKKNYPANTPFELRIGDTLQFRGRIDGSDMSSDESGSEIVFQGRDALVPLHRACVTSDQSFKNDSPEQMVLRAMKEVGITSSVLIVSNRQSIQERSKAKVANKGFSTTRQTARRAKPVAAKTGDRWYDLIMRELKREGLFLWCTPTGDFVLGCPNGQQDPIYRITRRRDLGINTVTGGKLHDNIANRHTSASVVAAGGGKGARGFLSQGEYVDAEMDALLDIKCPIVFRDVHAVDKEQAEFYARRKLAEERREGWNLSYTVAGHVTDAIDGVGQYIWTPDTCVLVDDDEFDVHGKFWIESCEYKGSESGTSTTLVLQRPEDLIFAEDL